MSSFLSNFTEEEPKEEKKEPKGIKIVENELENDTNYTKKKQKRLIIEIAVATAVIATIIILIIYFSKIEVPNFNNQLVSIADKWSTENKIQIIKKETYNNQFAEDYVISQSIKSGSKISKKTILEITVSKGSNPDEKITVPDLKKMTGAEIKAWIDDNNLFNTIITEINSKKIAKGNLISYTFDSATVDKNNFKRSDSLEIVISKGDTEENTIEIINLVSKTKEEATKWCSDNGLVCKFSDAISDDYELGKVISQSLKAGKIISPDTKMTFKVSVGKGITIPNYSGITSEGAASLNTKVDVKIKYVYSVDITYGNLISQSVKAGARKMETDNKVELVYSLGKPYFDSLVGEKESELAKIFYDYNQKGVQFTYTIKYINSEEEKGTIVSSSKSNEFVTMTENIEVRVSNGIIGG